MKIRTRFMLFLTIFVISVFAIMYFVSSQFSKNRIIDDIGNHINTAAKFKAYNIEELLKTYIEFTELIATGFPFVRYFSADNDVTNVELINIRINKIIKVRDSISRVRLLDAEGIVVISSHNDVGIDRSDKKIFLEGIKRTYISDFHFSEFTGEYVISVATPIFVNGEKNGVLVINFVVEEHLFPVLADRTSLMNSTNIYLLNKDYFLISPTRYVFISRY